MKVLQVIDTLNIGGAERMSINIANSLIDYGHESVLIATRSSGSLSGYLNPNVTLYILNKKNTLDIINFLKFISIVKKEKPDIIHVHSCSIFWGVLLKKIIRNINIIWHDHYGDSNSLKDTDRKFIQYLSPNLNGIISVNERLKKWSEKNMKVEANHIWYLPNFPYLNCTPKKISNKIPVILHLANFRPQKDHLTLLRASQILKEKNIDFRLILAGQIIDNNYYNTVKEFIKANELGDYIQIAGPVNNVEEILVKADIGVLSSLSEGLPVALLEYGLAGLSVVCTSVGQCPEVLGFGKYGRIVPPSDPITLASALEKVLDNKDSNLAIAQSFHNHVLQNYGKEGFIEKYSEFLKNII